MRITNTELQIANFSRDNGKEVFSTVSKIFNSSMKIKIVTEICKKEC